MRASRVLPKVSERHRSRTSAAASSFRPSALKASARANLPGALAGLAPTKKARTDGRALPLGQKRLLGPAAQERAGRPVGIRPGEGDHALEADAGPGADRHPFERARGRPGP